VYRTALCLAAALAFAPGARAETDWQAASKVWIDQYRELEIADAARRLCGVEVSAPVASAIRTTVAGLAQALGSFAPAHEGRAVVQQAGGPKPFCASTASMAAARATIARVGQQVAESGANITLPLKTASAAPAPAPVGITPVVDPNVQLIQGCRNAVNARLGKRSTVNKVFWSQYTACMNDQGAGWF
jgi:hypothetical protein